MTHIILTIIFAVITLLLSTALILTVVSPIIKDKVKSIHKRIITITVIIFAAITLVFIAINVAGMQHGMTKADMPTTEVIYRINHTPKQTKKLPEDTKGSIIVLYRFDCDDCTAIYDDLASLLNETVDKDNKNKIYYVSAESKLGKELAEEFSITEVPTGLYMRYNDYDESIKAVRYSLYTTDNNGDTILNTTTTNRLIYLQSEKK